MMISTTQGVPIHSELIGNYFHNLINMFFKILPLKENEEGSLQVYLQSLQLELLGCQSLIIKINSDAQFLSLLAILQFFIDNPSVETSVVKREVFHAISICNRLEAKFSHGQSEVAE